MPKKTDAKDWWKLLSAQEFEDAVAQYFRLNGYTVRQTKYARDRGVDLFLWDSDKRKYIVQCKHFAKPAGPNYLRELWGVLDDNKATAAYFVTLNGVSKEAKRFTSKKDFKIFTLKDLIKIPFRDIEYEMYKKNERKRKRKAKLTKKFLTKIQKIIFKHLIETLKSGGSFDIRNFGSFKLSKSLKGRRVLFTPSKEFKTKVNKKIFES